MLKKLGYLAVVAVVILGALFGTPKIRDTSGCLFCGRVRDESWWCGFKVRDRVLEREWSAWVDSFHPGHTNHLWGISSHSQRGWFGRTTFGCGGLAGSGVAQIHFTRTWIGDTRARGLLAAYHSQLATNQANLPAFLRQELHALPPPDQVLP